MRKWLAAVAVALVLFSMLTALVAPWPCPVTRTAFERIKKGMTQAEIYAILGGPPGDYWTRPVKSPFQLGGSLADKRGRMDIWTGDEGAVTIYYTRHLSGNQRVESAEFQEATPYTPTLVELVRWRLILLKYRWLQ